MKPWRGNRATDQTDDEKQVLIIAMAVSLAIKSWIEGTVIGIIIIMNISIGFFQELEAAKTMDSLKRLSSPTAKVIRSGNLFQDAPTIEIVPGDVVEVVDGDTIPADIRLIEAVNFETNEASITGESVEIRKNAEALLPLESPVGDRTNVAYSTCQVTKGRARGVVYATGKFTQVGRLAADLQGNQTRRREPKRRGDGSISIRGSAHAWYLNVYDAIGRFLGLTEGTPLQRKLSLLAIWLFVFAGICAMIVFGTNNFDPIPEITIYAVTTAVSMIPASLPVVLIITMAAGMRVMHSKHVIVRNLRSLEALGGMTGKARSSHLSWQCPD
jgi:P-type Na+/K+ transporter